MKEDDEGNVIVEATFSHGTMKLLEQLADQGLYGIGVEGVIEGFVYRGLQEVFQPPKIKR